MQHRKTPEEKQLYYRAYSDCQGNYFVKDLFEYLNFQYQHIMQEMIKEPDKRTDKVSDETLRGRLQSIVSLKTYVESELHQGVRAMETLAKS